MLGTYIVSAFWQGLYLVNKPEFAQYSSVQEMRAKAYYMKNGKYYYVKGGKRHGILKSDASGKSVDFADYNPGLETPIEIPAEPINTNTVPEGTIEIPAEPTNSRTNTNAVPEGTMEIPTETVVPATPAAKSATTVKPATSTTKPATTTAKPAATTKPSTTTKPAATTKPNTNTKPKQQPVVEDTGIDFGDGFGNQNRTQTAKKAETKKKKKPVVNIEDEYYDLEGF